MMSRLKRADRHSLFAIGFIIAAIVSLVLVPILGARYMRPLHYEMKTVVEPGRGSGAERARRAMTVVLGLVALSAVAVVVSLGRRLRIAEAAAERHGAQLQVATEGRARLTRGISRDLKNPLHAIDGHAQLLLDGLRGELSLAQADSVTRIRGVAGSLIRLVDDLLALSAAESGRLRFARRQVEMGRLVSEVCEEHRATAQIRNHELSVTVAPGVSSIETDPHRVKQVLENLLSNAIRHTPPGGLIELFVQNAVTRVAADKPERRYLCIAVADSGPGIPPGMMEEIFEEFRKLENAPDSAGSGLGLAIARRMAQLLGGHITVANRKQGGAVLTLLLPTMNESSQILV